MTGTLANTWPPLISGISLDEIDQKQLYGKEVISSCLAIAAQDDEFYFPLEGSLSGFGHDGQLYQNGARVPDAPGLRTKASWFEEGAGPFRGSTEAFPQRGLILLTDAGLSILDIEDRYKMWMIALRGDTLAYTHNFLGAITGARADSVTFQNGRVVIRLQPDPGSTFQAPVFLVFDFTLDQVYLERPAYRPPSVGPYSMDPASYTFGVAITPNVPAMDLVQGGRPTAWWVWPDLPKGLVMDPDTGIITGTPVELTQSRMYSIQAVNPGGVCPVLLALDVQEKVSNVINSFTGEALLYRAWIDHRLADATDLGEIFVVAEDWE